MQHIFYLALWIAFLLLPVVLIALDIVFAVKKKQRPIFELIAFAFGSIYMCLAFDLWSLPDYETPLNALDSLINVHEPINADYTGAILLFSAWGFLSYFILKFAKKKLSPLVEVILLAGVYVGIALSIVWMVQLLGGANPQGAELSELTRGKYKGSVEFHLESLDYLYIFCLCIVPVLFIIHCICLMNGIIKNKAKEQEQITYDNKVLNILNGFLSKGANLFWVAVVALLPILGILTMILVLFGQQPDSIILAFTKTSDWVLSGEIAPPPVAYDTHYLCTVSLRGHEKLVKPTRYGIRRGEKIVVNRQLCVANAFEQLIQEKTPRFHRALRNFYDTYGYPISRHINSAWSADVVYLLMKPLEWLFVLVLYLFDAKPENRISSQYLPKIMRW